MNFGFSKSCQASKNNFFFLQKKITISKKQIRFKKNHDKQKIFFRGKKTLQANVFCSIPCTWRILQENFPNKVKTIMQ
jgi:hypothetical protein